MKTQLMIFSYAPDLFWAKYLVRSIEKFVTGFSEVTIVVPWQDRHLFLPFEKCKTKDGASFWVKQYLPMQGRGHLHHQSMKCYGDIWCPEADYVAFVDSDTIFTAPFDSKDLFDNKKPILYVRPYSFYKDKPEEWWSEQVERALKIKADYATMEHVPEVYHRGLFKSLRDRVEEKNFIPFHEYVISQKADPLWGFSEFSTLGFWAMYNHANKYTICDLSKDKAKEMNCMQIWSHVLHKPELAKELKETVDKFEDILK